MHCTHRHISPWSSVTLFIKCVRVPRYSSWSLGSAIYFNLNKCQNSYLCNQMVSSCGHHGRFRRDLLFEKLTCVVFRVIVCRVTVRCSAARSRARQDVFHMRAPHKCTFYIQGSIFITRKAGTHALRSNVPKQKHKQNKWYGVSHCQPVRKVAVSCPEIWKGVTTAPCKENYLNSSKKRNWLNTRKMIRDGVDGQDRCLLLLSDTLTQLKQQNLRKKWRAICRCKTWKEI